MRRNRLTLILLLGAIGSSGAWAQCGDNALGCLFHNIYGPTGLVLPNPTHRAHFSNDSLQSFTPLNTALGTQISLLPLASPASGFTFTFDPAAGVYTRSSQSFGPIFSERAETMGRRKLYVAFTFQRYTFDKLDNLPLNNFPAVLGHDPLIGDPEFEKDVVLTQNSVDLKINQSTIFATYGLTNRLDVSVAIPIVSADMTAISRATIFRVAQPTASGQSHFFDLADPNGSIRNTFTNSSSASGIGDVTLRGKGNLWKNEKSGIAVGADVRLPSGDERNLLGSGAVGIKPFVAASTRLGPASPHVNLGYQWNGKSVLAGDIATGTKGSLPKDFFWTLGADVGVKRFVTFAFDVLGQHIFDAPRLVQTNFTTKPSDLITTARTFPTIGNTKGSLNIVNGSAGIKVSLGGNFLATVNLLIKLNDGGLRDNLSPLFGLSYTF